MIPLLITEIMYSPLGPNAGHEWVEVENAGTDPIDLGAKGIRLFDGSTDHLIKDTGAGTTLAPAAVAVIAQNPDAFREDWPSYSGLLLKSSFNLPAAATIAIQGSSGDLSDQAHYSSIEGALGDGNSLQWSGSTFKIGAPTPGVVPVVVPAPLAAPAKTSPFHSSARSSGSASTKRAAKTKQPAKKTASSKKRAAPTHSTATDLTDSAYDSGMTAPAATAITAAAGALFTAGDSLIAGAAPLAASVWFAAFLALLAFSGFSLILIVRSEKSASYA